MNTLKIKSKDIRNFSLDLKRLKIKHQPFKKYFDYYEIDIWQNPNISLLLLKYCT